MFRFTSLDLLSLIHEWLTCVYQPSDDISRVRYYEGQLASLREAMVLDKGASSWRSIRLRGRSLARDIEIELFLPLTSVDVRSYFAWSLTGMSSQRVLPFCPPASVS